MVFGRVLHLLFAIVFVLSPAHGADTCASTATTVRLLGSSHRNQTGHWITKAAVTRSYPKDFRETSREDTSWHYSMDVTSVDCGDAEFLTTTFTVVVPPSRGSGYKFFPNIGYYKLHTKELKWKDALKACAKEGAYLAVVNSEEEQRAIQEVISYHTNDTRFRAFIGFHDMFVEGEYVTIFGDLLNSTGYVNWGSSEPNNNVYDDGTDEDCGNIYIDGTINDTICTSPSSFLCEKSI